MAVIWITGLSGSGKTTLARHVVECINKKRNKHAIMLDGDELRDILGPLISSTEAYKRDERVRLAMCYSRLCRSIASQGLIVVIATISLFREVHEWNRLNISDYREVYLKVPLEELIRRDPKGIYRGYTTGSMMNIAGLDLEVDEPEMPDLIFDKHSSWDLTSMADKVLTFCL